MPLGCWPLVTCCRACRMHDCEKYKNYSRFNLGAEKIHSPIYEEAILLYSVYIKHSFLLQQIPLIRFYFRKILRCFF